MKKIWNWYYGTATIRKKLVISYLILILLPILILGLYSYHISKRSFLEQTKEICRLLYMEWKAISRERMITSNIYLTM